MKHRNVEEKNEQQIKKRKTGKVGKIVFRIFITFFVTLLIAVIGVYGLCYVVFLGPSESARDQLTLSALGTSAMQWLPYLYMPAETVDEIIEKNEVTVDMGVTDPSLIKFQDPSDTDPAVADEWADCPDGIRIIDVIGSTFRGKLMLVRDPSRVYLATSSDFKGDAPGLRIREMSAREGCAAVINAGGFSDPGGNGEGNKPNGLTFSHGVKYWGSNTTVYDCFIGFNEDNVLVVGSMSASQAMDMKIRDGVSFGPALVVNGEMQPFSKNAGGYNPRTCIGQRADGVVMLLAVDGRQPSSIGATYAQLAALMYEYGAVNAANLDGGSSTYMLYNGEVQNVSSSLYGQRKQPTFFCVAALEE